MSVEWYYATSPKATFGFEVSDGRVIHTAPYGRKWLIGANAAKAIKLLEAHGFTVTRGSP